MQTEHLQISSFHAAGSRRQRARPKNISSYHRIKDVLQEEEISFRRIAHRLGISSAEAQAEAEGTCDLLLSALFRWQAALNVPIADLITSPDESLSPEVAFRARLLKAMRTVRSIQLLVDDDSLQQLTISLVEQLSEMMLELNEVSAWPSVGRRRSLDELGAIAERPVPVRIFEEFQD